MSFFIALFFEFLFHDFFEGWNGAFLLVTILDFLIHQEDFNSLSWARLFGGLLGLGVLDLVKYGRVGIGLITLGLVWFCFCLVRGHFYAGRVVELIVLAGCCLIVEMLVIVPFLLEFSVSWAVTAQVFSGTVASVLVLLGMRGSRFLRSFTALKKRKVWTPNRKSAL